MQTLRLAAFAALVLAGSSAPASAGLVLIAGPNQGTFATNNYGYSGFYYDLRGLNGTSEYVSHTGGGPVSFLYIFGNGGAVSTYYDSTAGPYDSADDTQVGVLNLSNQSMASLTLKSSTTVFGFETDGIDSFGAPANGLDKTGYGGPQTYFSAITTDQTMGTANFIGGLAAGGGSTYFSLEEAITLSTFAAPVPEPSSMVMVGCGVAIALGRALRRRGSIAEPAGSR